VDTVIREKPEYFNPARSGSVNRFKNKLAIMLDEADAASRDIIIVCIGSDRATGDCLGPLVGERLNNSLREFKVFGTLEDPVHAINLADTIEIINNTYCDPLIIAIDASLGVRKHVGYVTIGKGGLRPGIGVGKDLPVIGEIYITGIVGMSGMLNQMLLQTTRLSLVMKLADFIYEGLHYTALLV